MSRKEKQELPQDVGNTEEAVRAHDGDEEKGEVSDAESTASA